MCFPLARRILASGSAIAGFDGPPFAAVVQTEPRPQVRAARGFAEVARRAWPKSPPNAASPQHQPAAERAAADSSGSGNNCEHMRTPPELDATGTTEALLVWNSTIICLTSVDYW